MKSYQNPPEFDDAKFSVVYGRNAAPEDGGDWCRRMINGVPTLLYREDKPDPIFDNYKRDPTEEDALKSAIAGSALFDDSKWSALSSANKDAFLRTCVQRIVKALYGLNS